MRRLNIASNKLSSSTSQRIWRNLPSLDRRILWGAILLSLLFHAASWFTSGWIPAPKHAYNQSAVNFRNVTAAEKKKLEKMQKDIQEAKHIVETKQSETEAPKRPANMGAQDHVTEKEMKLPQRKIVETKGMDAAQTAGQKAETQPHAPSMTSKPLSPPISASAIPKMLMGPGTMAVSTGKSSPRNAYEKLLPDTSSDVFAKPNNGGYVESVDADVAEGDHIDMNTSNFKFISYFSGLRKQIEMVWIYPSDAVQRGLQGAVQLEFCIEKDGHVSKIRIVNSSGYTTLDENMVKTLKLASPFAPLPKSWGKERVFITGSFHYVLSYAAH